LSRYVVVGAGGTGRATARLLADSGHSVRIVTRGGGGPDHAGVERVAADASDAERLTALAEGATALFNCAAPPYHSWSTLLPPLAASLLTAAERTGADYVMLGNLYAYGQVDGPMTEDLPAAPNSVKGRIRARAWQDALDAHAAGRVRVTEVRASDFIGADAYSAFTLTVVPRVLAGKRALVPADLDAPHSWTATGDAARTLIAAAGDERSWGRVWHVPTNPPVSVRGLAARLARQAGVPAPKLAAMPLWVLRAGGLFSPMVRELPEMQYQFRRPFELDSSRTEEALGLKPTPLDEVVREMLPAA
jgi:nucleoside-diphosphate-sugar epimerase